MKKILFPLSDLGQSTKSTILKSVSAQLTKEGVLHSKSDADNDHLSFYTSLAEKNAKGEILTKQDSISGCAKIDFNSPEEILNTTGLDTDINIIDTPGRAIDVVSKSMGDVGIFLNAFSTLNSVPYILTTYIDKDKSPKTLHKLDEIFGNVTLDNDAKIHIIIVLNTGFIHSNNKNNLNDIVAAYNKDVSIESMKANPRFVIHEIEFKTQLNTITKELVSTKSITDILNGSVEPVTKVLLMGLLNDASKITKILNS